MDVSSDGSFKGKRKLVIEEASGPAWGAQSYAANKNYAIDKSTEDSENDPGLGDFGRYFSEKKRKLRDQFHQHAAVPLLGYDPRDVTSGTAALSEAVKTKRLFDGVSIFVDGFTTPTHQELRFLMMNHGGVFENYFSSQRVTHIICSTLPDSKIMNPRLMSRGLPIVKPSWIVDSINENRLLPWGSYQLERIAYSHPHQKTIAASFSLRKEGDFATKDVARIAQNAVDGETKTLVDSNHKMAMSPADTLGEPERNVQTKLLHPEQVQNSEEGAHGEVAALPLVNRPHESAGIGPELASGTDEHLLSKGDAPNAAAVQKQLTKKPTTVGRGHSTLDDPDFIHSYYKNSRLHFIGTWRNRYQNLVNAGSFGQRASALPAASSSGRPVIIHLDMDCFFVSVVVRNHPGLTGKPVAVCHSNSAQGTGEISSANYLARSYGVRAGMFVRHSKALCPELAIVPYDFPAYEQVADTVYGILHKYCSTVQAVSCDEAFLDVSGYPEPANLASKIREEIFQATQCTASAGIAENLLLARLATKKAKPNGLYVIQPHEVKEFMSRLPLDELPGVGWTLREKLHGNGLYTCADVQQMSKDALQQVYGAKTGVMLLSYAHGIDNREVQPVQERKSIGAEVNWGVRFSCADDAQQFLVTLCNEVASRMQKCSSTGRTITLKVKRRKEGVGEPVKFMGCGVCDNLSRSETVGNSTNSAKDLLSISRQLFASLHLDVQEVRGVGLQVSRLVSTNAGGPRKQHNAFESWLAPSTKLGAGKEAMHQVRDDAQCITGAAPDEQDLHDGAGPSSPRNETDCEDLKQGQGGKSELIPQAIPDRRTPTKLQLSSRTITESKKQSSTSLELPPFCEIDPSVLECLPADIVAEIMKADKAREEPKNKDHLERAARVQPQVTSGMHRPSGGQLNGRTKRGTTKPRNGFLKLPPQSQLDPSVLESLPEDIRAEINHAYEQELKQKPSADQRPRPLPNPPSATSGACVSLTEKTQIINRAEVNESVQQHELISGETNLCGQLQSVKRTVYEDMFWNIIAGMISGPSCKSLSSGLLCLRPSRPPQDAGDAALSENFMKQCSQLLIDHVRAIAPKDLEEVHLILLYLKRLGTTSNLWRAVQELTVPPAKDIISELYGGRLNHG